MHIINPQVTADLAAGKKIRLNLGTGGADPDGAYSVDHLELPGVDIVADLNAPMDLIPDNSVSELVSSHTFEHVQNFMGLMHEVHRVVEPGGTIRIIVPHFSCTLGYSDPTHVRFFGLYTMLYFVDRKDMPWTHVVPSFYTNIRFQIRSSQLFFYDWGTFLHKRLGPWMTRFWNKSIKRQHFYESRLCFIYPVDEVRFELSPVKAGVAAEG